MANHKSAIKRNKQNIKRRAENRNTKTALRSAAKKVLSMIEAKDVNGAKEALKAAEKVWATAAAKRVIHPKNASRKISRLAGHVNSASAA